MPVLRATKAPNLMNSPQAYTAQHFDQTKRELRTYFNGVDNFSSALAARYGGDYLSFSYGQFYDTTTQTAVSTTAAYALTFTNTAFSQNVTLVDTSKITFATAGIYNLQFSVQLSNNTTDVQEINVWFKRNGTTDITDSNSKFGMAPRKSTGAHYHTIAAVNFLVDVAADDYIELMWCTSDLSANIEYYTAGTTPDRPATPSVVLTATRVSAEVPNVYA